MSGAYLLSENKSDPEGNIYTDRSALVLEWLLLQGISRDSFSLREVSRYTKVSVGLVQKIFSNLVLYGVLETEGVRTSKIYKLSNSKLLLDNWINHYSIVKKCKMKNYSSGYRGRKKLLEVLEKSNLSQSVMRALHSSAEALRSNNTNLDTLELYVLEPNIRSELEDILQLEERDKGYEVLLIEPYYKQMIKNHVSISGNKDDVQKILFTPPLLTFLDLYHFPLRGIEQAEYLAQNSYEIRRIINGI